MGGAAVAAVTRRRESEDVIDVEDVGESLSAVSRARLSIRTKSRNARHLDGHTGKTPVLEYNGTRLCRQVLVAGVLGSSAFLNQRFRIRDAKMPLSNVNVHEAFITFLHREQSYKASATKGDWLRCAG
ncbi:acyl-CoA oxidase [Pseudozyma hubeiensis SY62]|uniref:Acyl-CoA oxidase n=1 Tax=Pseudozyma hubeiensis (strain SY62) TaxID=1305764 RepID=R9P922_PSEHS|nr:acyl-CoA oxidase [Pseudozyma hubeiensis SY62]GAC97851.1 acyl-CoA oxidase [Pseudozyma hubeiensis SY62]